MRIKSSVKKQAKKIETSQFSLVELLVVIGMLILIVSLLRPSIASAIEKANLMKCAINENYIYTAVSMYTDEYHNVYPEKGDSNASYNEQLDWDRMIAVYLGYDEWPSVYASFTVEQENDLAVFRCPSSTQDFTIDTAGDAHFSKKKSYSGAVAIDSYGAKTGLFHGGVYTHEVTSPSEVVMLGELWWDEIYNRLGRDKGIHAVTYYKAFIDNPPWNYHPPESALLCHENEGYANFMMADGSSSYFQWVDLFLSGADSWQKSFKYSLFNRNR
ncbi:MAG: type II secretion system protein [Planctomycetes bacterium]|nr:type II secretion system protein [Planctomycetota bacterium]